MMDLMQSFDAILFPADGRPPHVVSLMTSPASFSNHPHAPTQTSAERIPHPEVHMEYIAEDPNMRAWHFQYVEALDMMNKKFANPYIIYYPVISRDGMPFPVNRTVRDIQEEVNKGRRLPEDQLWRGNLVAAKFADDHFTQMIDASMADFPILKNFLGTHASPCNNNDGGGGSSCAVQMTHSAHPSPPSLHATAGPSAASPHPPPHHPAAQHMSFEQQQQQQHQHVGGVPQAPMYEREQSIHPHVHPHAQAHAHAHGVPMGMPVAPRRSPKTAGAEYQHQQHQHQHQHQQQQQQQQQQHYQPQHQHQPPMEL